jgi:hypothetical protein
MRPRSRAGGGVATAYQVNEFLRGRFVTVAMLFAHRTAGFALLEFRAIAHDRPRLRLSGDAPANIARH